MLDNGCEELSEERLKECGDLNRGKESSSPWGGLGAFLATVTSHTTN